MVNQKGFKFQILVLMFLLCISRVVSSAQNTIEFEGLAYDLDSSSKGDNKDLIYTEHHTVYLDQDGRYLRQNVEYKSPEGDLLVHKTLEYGLRDFLPSMSVRDKRNNHGMDASVNEQYLDFESGDSSTSERVAVALSSNTTSVLDAGFDRLLAKNWDKLRAGTVLEFDFFAPTRATMIGFQLSAVPSSEAAVARFKIEPSSWIIRLLVEPIVLDYDAVSRRLMRYKGITNIARSEGSAVLDENYRAEIVYRYINPAEPTL